MAEDSKPHWWQTVPGVFTALAAIITALTGLVVALNQAGFFEKKPQKSVTPVAIIEKSSKPASTPTTTVNIKTPESSTSVSENTPIAPSTSLPLPKEVNLLASENGGHLLTASSDDWGATIDGKEDVDVVQGEAVYGFKDGKSATFDLFTTFIPQADQLNPKEIELLVSSESPSTGFVSIGIFKPQNMKLFDTPYQQYKFAPVTAKYFKVKMPASSGLYIREFQLFGTMQ